MLEAPPFMLRSVGPAEGKREGSSAEQPCPRPSSRGDVPSGSRCSRTPAPARGSPQRAVPGRRGKPQLPQQPRTEQVAATTTAAREEPSEPARPKSRPAARAVRSAVPGAMPAPEVPAQQHQPPLPSARGEEPPAPGRFLGEGTVPVPGAHACCTRRAALPAPARQPGAAQPRMRRRGWRGCTSLWPGP